MSAGFKICEEAEQFVDKHKGVVPATHRSVDFLGRKSKLKVSNLYVVAFVLALRMQPSPCARPTIIIYYCFIHSIFVRSTNA